MRIFSYEELDELGEGLIRQYLGKEAERTCCVDIEGFVTDFLKLPLLYHFIRRTSDRICKEHGLSVIVPGQDRGKSYIEHQAERNGTSYKAKLRAAIDRLLPGCHDLEELLVRLQREGYALKRGKYISARAPGQERFTRLKTLGADYAEDALTARLAGRARPSRQPKHQSGKISLLIDTLNTPSV